VCRAHSSCRYRGEDKGMGLGTGCRVEGRMMRVIARRICIVLFGEMVAVVGMRLLAGWPGIGEPRAAFGRRYPPATPFSRQNQEGK
jgi:hypothetical protein